MSSQGLKRSLPTDEESSQSPRPRKRPGGASRLTNHDKAVARDALLKRQQEREQEARKAAAIRGVHDVVRQHYNAVPQRGRDWRKTESRIKGLRSFNNWVKSTIIHKFSPDASPESGKKLRVLDLGCGKGGDLGKWQQAPQPVELIVGIDPAEVSVDQARERYMQMRGRGGRGFRGPSRIFDAEFYAQDAFGQTIGTIPIIRDVGYDAPNSRRGGGFDVVSMMFCMHYAFESEAKTRGMLQNVSGSLKKGGRFIGAIPSSDVIRAKVQAFYKAEEALQSQKEDAGLFPGVASIADTKPSPTREKTPGPIREKIPAPPQEKVPAPPHEKVPAPHEKIPAPTQEQTPAPTQETTPASTQEKIPAPIQEKIPAPSPEKTPAHTRENIPPPIQEKIPVEKPPAPTQERTAAPRESLPSPPQEETRVPPHEKTPASTQEKTPAPTRQKISAPIQKKIPVEKTPAHTQENIPPPIQEKPPPPLQQNLPPPLQEKTRVPTHEKPPAPTQEKTVAPPYEQKPSEFPAVAEWGNSLYRVRFSGPAPKDGMFRPPFGWKYSFFLEEAVEVPEYVVPWEAFRA